MPPSATNQESRPATRRRLGAFQASSLALVGSRRCK